MATSTSSIGFSVKREGFILENENRMLSEVYDVDSKKLGQGTYGSVSTGTNKSTHAVRAIKKISKAQLKNLVRFRQEVILHLFQTDYYLRFLS